MNDFDVRYPRWYGAFEIAGALMLNTFLFWVATGLIVTAPVAVTGMFAGLSGVVRPVPAEMWSRFFRAARRTYGRSLVLYLANLGVGFFLWFDIRLFFGMGSLGAKVVAYLFVLIAIFVAMVNLYAWPMLAWYPRPLGKVLKHAVLLTVAHPFEALGGLAVIGSGVWLILTLQQTLAFLLLLIGPAAAAYVMGKAAWRVLERYPLPEEELTFRAG